MTTEYTGLIRVSRRRPGRKDIRLERAISLPLSPLLYASLLLTSLIFSLTKIRRPSEELSCQKKAHSTH
jgi:hypothetical protein